MYNPLLLSDSYKYSHYNQYPENTKRLFSYFESRGGKYQDIILHGLEYYLSYLKAMADNMTTANAVKLEHYSAQHGIPFNPELWEELLLYVKEHDKLPIEIHAVPENIPMPTGVALFTIENTDDRFFWLVTWLETLLMKIWYPTTIASKSYAIKQLLKVYYDSTSDNPAGIEYAYHNFGDRGSSSVESALIGGLAHLSQFKGTDNFHAACHHIVKGGVAVSIPASEHSTVTSWGRDNEFRFIRNYLELYKNSPIIACVLDSYNIYDAVGYVTSALRPLIESDEYPIFVMRPDSGEPVQVIQKLLAIIESNKVAYKINSKGFKVWNKYRIIWGDGVTPATIADILNMMQKNGYAVDNIAFGSGGDLMQNLTRDTCKFAIKVSAIQIGDKWQDVYKEPVDDKSKTSKRGKLITIRWKTSGWADKKVNDIQTIRAEDFDTALHEPLMTKVY